MLPPLATLADLAARNICVPDAVDADTILGSASTAVRSAAGCAISQTSSTVTLESSDWCELKLPAGPVISVDSVTIEGNVIPTSVLANRCYSTGWRLVGNRILFTGVYFTPPTEITVTYTHGLPVVPADIVDLVCGVASMAMAAGASGSYGSGSSATSIRLGDFAETREVPAGTDSPSPVTVSDAVRDRLRARFGTSVAAVGISR